MQKLLDFFFLLFSFEFCSYYQKTKKENSNFSIFRNKITVILDNTFTNMQKPVRLQVPFDNKGKI